MIRVRYILLGIILMFFASCAKNQDDSIVETRFTYYNPTLYKIDINVYARAQESVKFSYAIMLGDSLALDFHSVGTSANPFGAPEVDSSEVVFDGGRRLIYSLQGLNGELQDRNIFYRNNPGYTKLQADARTYRYAYTFSNTDYFNAR